MIRYLFAFLLFINLSQSLFSKELLNSNFDNVTKNEINKLIKNYILDNPEIVIEAIELFQKKQSSNAIKKQKETIKSLSVELYDDTNSYFFGNENSELKIVFELSNPKQPIIKRITQGISNIVFVDKSKEIFISRFNY